MHISSLLRRFSPLSEDTQAITSALSVAVKTEDVNDEGAMDFLDDNDDLMQIGELSMRICNCCYSGIYLCLLYFSELKKFLQMKIAMSGFELISESLFRIFIPFRLVPRTQWHLWCTERFPNDLLDEPRSTTV